LLAAFRPVKARAFDAPTRTGPRRAAEGVTQVTQKIALC